MSNDNAGKYALITGGTSGFGYEFAKLFAKDGFNLILVARSDENLEHVKNLLTQEFMIDVVAIDKDLFDPNAAREIYEEVKVRGIVVDTLVNNAGQGQHGNFVEYEISRDIDIIQLNVTSVVALTKYFLTDMLSRNEGRILNVASLLAKYPTPYMSVYAATKSFIISFSEGLIQELKDTNITITALLPGPADTDFFHKAGAEETKTYREDTLSKPEEVARDGYDALMKGERRTVSGMKNKVYAAMSTAMPDHALAKTMGKNMLPSDEPDGRSHITHGPSIEERDSIERSTGSERGDYDEHEDHVHNK